MRTNGTADRPKSAGMRLELAKTLNIPIYSVQDGLKVMRNVNND